MQTTLPGRKFDLGDFVWARIRGCTWFGRIIGYEDGRQLERFRGGPWPGWTYHVRLESAEPGDPFSAVGEADLAHAREGEIQLLTHQTAAGELLKS